MWASVVANAEESIKIARSLNAKRYTIERKGPWISAAVMDNSPWILEKERSSFRPDP